MKRTPLRRGRRLRPVSKRRQAQAVDYRLARGELMLAADGECQVRGPGCTGAGQDAHHVTARGRAGPLLPGEGQRLIYVCRADHDYIHAHPGWARERGLLT